MDNTSVEIEPQDLREDEIGSVRVEEVDLDIIDANPFQPRKQFKEDKVRKLAASIKENGLIHPILLRPKPGAPGRFELIAGESRVRAMRMNRFEYGDPKTIMATIRLVSDVHALELALEENVNREDINPIDEADGYVKLEAMGRTQEQIAKRFGITAQVVSNRVRLKSLPEPVQEYIADGVLAPSHGVVLLALQRGVPGSYAAEIVEFGAKAASGRWSVADLNAEINSFLAEQAAANSPELPMGDEEDVETVDAETVDAATGSSEDAPGDVETQTDQPTGTTEPSSPAPEVPAAKKPVKKELFAIGDKVQWNTGGKRSKWLTGVVAERGRALIWVQPTGTTEPGKRQSFAKKNCILQPWDGKTIPNAAQPPTAQPPAAQPAPAPAAAPVKTAKEIAESKASAPTAATPAPEKSKTPPGFIESLVPEVECFKLADAGIPVPEVFQLGCQLLEIAQANGLTVHDVVATIENFFAGKSQPGSIEQDSDKNDADEPGMNPRSEQKGVAVGSLTMPSMRNALLIHQAERWEALRAAHPDTIILLRVGVMLIALHSDARTVARECGADLLTAEDVEGMGDITYCVLNNVSEERVRAELAGNQVFFSEEHDEPDASADEPIEQPKEAPQSPALALVE